MSYLDLLKDKFPEYCPTEALTKPTEAPFVSSVSTRVGQKEASDARSQQDPDPDLPTLSRELQARLSPEDLADIAAGDISPETIRAFEAATIEGGKPAAALSKYDAACRAVAACASIDEAKDWANKMTALAAYARQAKNFEMEIHAAEIRVRARRRMGEISATLEKSPGMRTDQPLPDVGKRSKEEVLEEAGISTSEAHRCEQIASIREADIEAKFAECREKGKPITSDDLAMSVTRQASEDKRKVDLERPVDIELPEGVIHGDFYDLSRSVPDDSIDLIFTDPPYDADSVPLYEKAAEVAARILKPGGSFIAYSGQKHILDVGAVCRKHLIYWWLCAGIHDSDYQILQKLGIRCGWKPLVWFVKQTRGDVQNVMLDTVRSGREKDIHEWQQAIAEARYFIQRLSTPGGYVVDFFLGSGTTAVAAAELGRRFIGYEINAGTVERAARRIAA